MRISDWSSDVCSSDLTGAMIISLGNEYAGIFANDDGLADDLIAAGKASGDQLWRLALGDADNKLIDSPIDDMKKIGKREGGSLKGAPYNHGIGDEGVKRAELEIAVASSQRLNTRHYWADRSDHEGGTKI